MLGACCSEHLRLLGVAVLVWQRASCCGCGSRSVWLGSAHWPLALRLQLGWYACLPFQVVYNIWPLWSTIKLQSRFVCVGLCTMCTSKSCIVRVGSRVLCVCWCGLLAGWRDGSCMRMRVLLVQACADALQGPAMQGVYVQ